MTAVAALGSGAAPSRAAGPRGLVLAAYLAGAGVVMVSLALLAGFVNMRSLASEWPPKGVHFDEYLSIMGSATLLLSAVMAGWASAAATVGNRRQALAGLGLTIGLGLAFANLAWYTGTTVGFGAWAHPFGGLVLTSLAISTAVVLAGTGFIAVAIVRTLVRADDLNSATITAATRFWFFVVTAWLLSPVGLYGLMSPK